MARAFTWKVRCLLLSREWTRADPILQYFKTLSNLLAHPSSLCPDFIVHHRHLVRHETTRKSSSFTFLRGRLRSLLYPKEKRKIRWVSAALHPFSPPIDNDATHSSRTGGERNRNASSTLVIPYWSKCKSYIKQEKSRRKEVTKSIATSPKK